MPEFDNASVSENRESNPSSTAPSTQLSMPTSDWIPGVYSSFDVSDQPFVNVSPKAKNALYQLVITAARTDVASRRFEVEQAWEARLFERGYQHLLPRRGGGWSLPGENSRWGPLSTADSSALYATNIYGRDKDIIVGAIAREIPEIVFFAQKPTNPADANAADGANDYVQVYEKNNDLRLRLSELAYYFYTDDRAILYTRQVADEQRFGTNEDGTPAVREITNVYGKLEGKVPMQAQYQSEMHFLQLYSEIDVTTAKARYPWVADQIRPGSTGIGEIELDKIARVNTKLALLGSYVTGDAMMRDVTEQFTWLRPEMFWDEQIDLEARTELLEKFPKGCLIICAGQIMCGVRPEAMDDHLHVTHAHSGIGQNRRALGTNNISVQKRLNAYLDIMDDFFRRTVPRRYYHADAFDIKALQQQDNIPGGSTPYLPQPNSTVQDLVWVEPTPQPQPALPDFVNLYFEAFPQSLVGAVPSLYGASTNTDTVGGISIQRDQALARIGPAWNAAKTAFAEAARQAVLAAATRDQQIQDTLPDGTSVSIDPAVLRGNVVCYPEYDQSFPESWKEKELRYTEITTQAPVNPFYAQLLQDPANMRAIADNVRMADLKIPGEVSVRKQEAEIDQLKNNPPAPNPAAVEMGSQLDAIKQGMEDDMNRGVPIPPEAGGMITQLEQAHAQMPAEVTSIPVAQDQSENHSIEAMVCFDWLNGSEGQKFKYGTAEQQMGWQNIYLHWQGHTEMAAKFKDTAVQHPPSISIPFDKMPPDAQTQALSQAGIKSDPQSLVQTKLVDTQHKIAQKVVPKTVPESINVKKLSRDNAQPPTNSVPSSTR